MPLTKEQTKYFEKILKEKVEALRLGLSDIAHKKKGKANYDFEADYPDFGSDEDENAQEVAVYVDRLSVEGTLEKELRDLESALKRIKDGTYGICKYCHQDIGEARLKIRPSSSACINCKKKFKGEN